MIYFALPNSHILTQIRPHLLSLLLRRLDHLILLIEIEVMINCHLLLFIVIFIFIINMYVDLCEEFLFICLATKEIIFMVLDTIIFTVEYVKVMIIMINFKALFSKGINSCFNSEFTINSDFYWV